MAASSLEASLAAAFVTQGIFLNRKLGEGTFKWAYKATHNGASVAVKIVKPQHFSNPRQMESVRRELVAMGSVASPHLVTFFRAGSITALGTKTIYWLEELVEGEDLAEVIKRDAPIEWRRASGIVQGLSLAVSALAKANIVHRDIKPQNVRITRTGIAKLLDLGIARHLALVSQTDSLAIPGPGTPLYMAPEQIKNEKRLINERTDQFALGIVFYEMLTGGYPFHKDWKSISRDRLFDRILNVAPMPTSYYATGVPTTIECIVLRMLAKHPSQRFRNCQAVRDALQGAV